MNFIDPIDLLDFLTKVLGWELVPEGLADRLYVLRNPQFPRRQLVFPMETTAPDYAESTGRVFEKLGEMLSESSESLLNRATSRYTKP